MPNYEYECYGCDYSEDRFVKYNERLNQKCLYCGHILHYVFPIQAALGFQPQEAYYDESLGCDVHGKREQSQICDDLGLIQAGDTTGGARNLIEPSEDTVTIGRQQPRGIQHSDNQRKAERGKEHASNALVTTMHKDGTERTFRNADASTDTRKGFKVRTQVPGTTKMRDINRTGKEK